MQTVNGTFTSIRQSVRFGSLKFPIRVCSYTLAPLLKLTNLTLTSFLHLDIFHFTFLRHSPRSDQPR